MSNILCFDFSSHNLVVAASINGKLYSFLWEAEKNSSEKIWEVLHSIFRIAGEEFDNVDVYGIGIGPGYFTGMRVALSIVKGFNLARKSKIVAIPSYDILAHALLGIDRVCVSFDARRNLFYAACYRRKKGRIEKILSERLIDYSQLQKFIERDFYLCGDAANFLSPQDREKAKIISASFWKINPYVFIDLCREKALKGKFTDVRRLNLLYLHPQTCQIRK